MAMALLYDEGAVVVRPGFGLSESCASSMPTCMFV